MQGGPEERAATTAQDGPSAERARDGAGVRPRTFLRTLASALRTNAAVGAINGLPLYHHLNIVGSVIDRAGI